MIGMSIPKPGAPGQQEAPAENMIQETAQEFQSPDIAPLNSPPISSSSRPRYPEELDPQLLGNEKAPTTFVEQKMRDLHKQSPAERAKTGALFGMGIGTAAMGETGALVGAAMGATLGRGLGITQNGELEDQNRMQGIGEMLSQMQVVNRDNGSVDIGEGVFNVFETEALRDVDEAITGRPSRNLYETDESSPFYNRALSMAKPLAYAMTYGVMDHSRANDNPRDAKELENVTGLFFNMIASDADNIEVVRERAIALAGKLGYDSKDKLDAIFNVYQKQILPTDMPFVRRGLSSLFPDDEERLG